MPSRNSPPEYVWTKKDPRNTPLNQCYSLGDLMMTIEKCKELDKRDRKKKRKKKK